MNWFSTTWLFHLNAGVTNHSKVEGFIETLQKRWAYLGIQIIQRGLEEQGCAKQSFQIHKNFNSSEERKDKSLRSLNSNESFSGIEFKLEQNYEMGERTFYLAISILGFNVKEWKLLQGLAAWPSS